MSTALVSRDLIGTLDREKAAPELHRAVDKLSGRWLSGIEQRLEGREWIATDEFTVAGIIMAGVRAAFAERP